MFATYYDSAEGITITPKRADRECRNHGTTLVELLAENGEAEREEYDAQWLLGLLGY